MNQDAIDAEYEEGSDEKAIEEVEEVESIEKFDFLTVISVIAVSLLAIWLVSVFQPLIAMVLSSTGWRLAIASILLATVIVAMLSIIGVVVYRYFKLPKIVSFDRGKMNNDEKLARILKKKYLKRWMGYKFNEKKETNAAKLNECLKWLQENDTRDASAWLDKLKEFQDELDKAADDAIGRFSTRIGGYTVVSQLKMTDIFAVIFFSTLMLRYLGELYRQRVAVHTAVKISAHWIANVYFSGWLQGRMKTIIAKAANALGTLAKVAAPVVGVAGESVAPGSGTGFLTGAGMTHVAGAAISYAGEFFVNKLLAKRLGNYYKNNLHFLKDGAKPREMTKLKPALPSRRTLFLEK